MAILIPDEFRKNFNEYVLKELELEDIQEISWLKEAIEYFRRAYLKTIFFESSKLDLEIVKNLEKELYECERLYRINWSRDISDPRLPEVAW